MLADRKIKIFADTADLAQMRSMADLGAGGFTTNPTLMRRAGVTDYRAFAREALAIAAGRPVSFEVVSDDFGEMERQAREIASWGQNAYVKIPVTDTSGASSAWLIATLAHAGVPVNVTAVFTQEQVEDARSALSWGVGGVVSVFAGRLADTGADPLSFVRDCTRFLRGPKEPRVELLWASPRQVYDVVLAERAGADIITMTPELIAKLSLLGKDPAEYSLETVRMFYADARVAGYAL
jgi:transaldolase